jgi:translocation and assembly module TamB
MIINADLEYMNRAEDGDDVLARLKTVFANLELRDNILSLHDSILSSLKSSLLVNGYIDFNKNTLQLDMLLNSENAADITAPTYTRIISPVRFIGRTTGSLDDPEISGRLEAGPGSIQGIPFKSAFADLAYSTKALNVEQLQIKQEKAEYDLKGNIAFRKSEELFTFKAPYYRAEALLKEVDITPFITAAYTEIPVKGVARGVVNFEGDSEHYKADTDLKIIDGEVYGQPIKVIEIKSSISPEGINFHSVEANNDAMSLSAEGTLDFDGLYEVFLSLEGIELGDYNMFRDEQITSSASIQIKGKGNINNPSLDYSAILSETSYRGIELGDGVLAGALNGGKLSTRGSFANAVITVDAESDIGNSKSWSADILFHKGDYGFLLDAFVKDPPHDLALSMEGSLALKGDNRITSLDAVFDSLDLSLYGYLFRNREKIILELSDTNSESKSFALSGDKANIEISGGMSLNQKYNLRVEGNIDMAPLRIISENLSSVRGLGNLTLDVTGAWNNPQIEGKINLEDATAAFSEFAYKVGPMNGTLYFKKDRMTFEELTADFAGGRIVLSGAGYFKNLTFKKLFVSTDISGIKIRPSEGVSSEISGQLFYEASPQQSTVTGDINIIKAKYGKDIDWKSWIMGLSDLKGETTSYPEFMEEMGLNIRISSENITIHNNIAEAPVRMSLNVTGTLGQTGLIGRMEASEGVIFFRSNKFNILEGSSVDFIKSNSIEPVFHIVADTYSSDHYIKLSMDGTIDKFDLTMFSDPPLSETEILTLLTFGQIDKEARGFDSGVAASEATALLTGALQEQVEEEFESITGLERFEIEPHTTTSGAFSPKVTIGKHLLEGQILVTYSTAVGTVEEQMINVEYKLNENLSVIGSRNEIGSAGVDVKYRFEFK